MSRMLFLTGSQESSSKSRDEWKLLAAILFLKKCGEWGPLFSALSTSSKEATGCKGDLGCPEPCVHPRACMMGLQFSWEAHKHHGTSPWVFLLLPVLELSPKRFFHSHFWKLSTLLGLEAYGCVCLRCRFYLISDNLHRKSCSQTQGPTRRIARSSSLPPVRQIRTPEPENMGSLFIKIISIFPVPLLIKPSPTFFLWMKA